VPPAFDRLAKNLFGQTSRIAVGRVEHIAAGLQRYIDQPRRFLHVAAPHFLRNSLPPPKVAVPSIRAGIFSDPPRVRYSIFVSPRTQRVASTAQGRERIARGAIGCAPSGLTEAAGTQSLASFMRAKQVTSVIPIVFPLAADPIGAGLVVNLSRPGANVTGLSLQQTDTAGKRVELFCEAVSGLYRLAVLANIGNPGAVLETSQVLAAARAIGLEVVTLEIRRAEDIAPAFEAYKDRADGLYVTGDPLAFTNINQINTLALGARLPTTYVGREYIESGGLMSYGPSYADLYRRAAGLVDKILRGAKPADLRVEQPTKFDFVINLTTAKALGLDVPPTLLARTDEMIE
jgi:putative ABC transport system substrate-binding protein